MTTKLRKSD